MKKQLNSSEYSYSLLFVILMVGSLISCSKDHNSTMDNPQMYTTSGQASGSQENPPTTSSGSGTLTGTYDATTNVWQYTITWTNLSSAATVVQLHGPASAGVNGALMFSLSITTPGASGSASGSMTLNAQQEADMLANKCYYNILSSTYLTGEIRGQITASVHH